MPDLEPKDPCAKRYSTLPGFVLSSGSTRPVGDLSASRARPDRLISGIGQVGSAGWCGCRD